MEHAVFVTPFLQWLKVVFRKCIRTNIVVCYIEFRVIVRADFFKRKLLTYPEALTAFLYGTVLDVYMLLLSFETPASFLLRLLLFVGGLYVSAFGIAFFFKTYIAPDIHALFIKEVSEKWNRSFACCKTIYDCTFLTIALVLSLLFFGNIQGVGIGTVVCAFINGTVIRMFTNIFNKLFIIRDAFPVRNRFEESEEVL